MLCFLIINSIRALKCIYKIIMNRIRKIWYITDLSGKYLYTANQLKHNIIMYITEYNIVINKSCPIIFSGH